MILRPRTALAMVALLFTLSACDPNRFVSGWVPSWRATDGTAAVNNADSATLFSEVSPFWYSATAAATITQVGAPGSLTTTVAAARAKGLPVLPSITDGTGKLVLAGILADPASRTTHVNAIVALVMANGFDGIDLDYEGFAFSDGSSSWATTKPNWVLFVQQLANALHAKGKLLSITIPPEGTVANYWVYAQADIAEAADRIRLMVYDYSYGGGPSGPVAPIDWVDQVIAYSGSRVPPAKLQLGVPTYGRRWAEKALSTETCPDGTIKSTSPTMKDAATLAAQMIATRGAVLTRERGENKVVWTERVTGPRTAPIPPPTFPPPSVVVTHIEEPGWTIGLQRAARLTPPGSIVSCTLRHTMWYPDAASVVQRAQAAINAGWSGIVIWALGYEDPTLWPALSQIAPQRPNGGITGSIDELAVIGTSVRVTGWGADPEFDLPIPVAISIDGVTTTRLARLARDDVAAAYPGIGPFHGFSVMSVALPPGNHQVCVTLPGWVGQVATPLGSCQVLNVPSNLS